ncbi:MAG TPA: hypothetical protein VK891_09250 [Euzebyales bacterium]|nr:hypothetical protein [Euzebyales bacterium]
MVAPDDARHAGDLPLLQRVTRAQKVVAGAGLLGTLIAVVATGQPLPWPLSALRQLLGWLPGADAPGDVPGVLVDHSPYPVAVALLAAVVLAGPVVLWLVMSWRIARFVPLPLVGFVSAGVLFFALFSRSPMLTLWGWLVVATLAIAYLNYYRKGRFGYTRGTTAAIFAHVALMCFFVALPLVLIELLGADAGADVTQRGSTAPDCGVLEMTPEGCQTQPAAVLPPHDVRPITADGRIEVATDATSPAALRALFDQVRAVWDVGRPDTPDAAAYRDRLGAAASEVAGDAGGLFRAAQPSIEVRIRCAAVPDLPDVDPVLATGRFALTDQGAQQIGLASTDEVVFETSGRRDCDPPPAPRGAVTVEQVFGAVEEMGLDVTNPRTPTIATLDPEAAGLTTCYAYGCLQQVETDQFTVTVWPTAEAARARVDRVPGEAVGGQIAAGWLGALAMGVLDPFRHVVPFGPLTTVHLSADFDVYEAAVGCRDPDIDACVDAYLDRLEAAATRFDGPGDASAQPSAAASDPAAPAGAQRLAGGGALHPNVAPVAALKAATLDAIDLRDATAVAVDPDGGVWILVQGEPGTGRRPIVHGHRSTALRVLGDRVDVVREIPAGSVASLLTSQVGGEVSVGVHRSGESGVAVLAADPADDRTIAVPAEDLVQVGPLALTDDGGVVAGHTDRARIDAFPASGGVHHLLGFSGFDPDARVQVDEPLGDIAAVAALPGDRVAFVTSDDDRRLLRVLDRDEVRTVALPRTKRQVHTVGPAPGDRLLAVAAGPDTYPQIQTIDVETGAVEVVAALEGVVAHADGPRGVAGVLWPVAAATDGHDLVFLADGYLWRLPGVFG